MTGAYQAMVIALVVITAEFAMQARTRAPEGAASTEASAVVNMGVREPHRPGCVNAISQPTHRRPA